MGRSSGAASTKRHHAGALLETSAVQLGQIKTLEKPQGLSMKNICCEIVEFLEVNNTYMIIDTYMILNGSINTSSLIAMLLELCLLVCPLCRARHCIFSYCEANLDSQFHGMALMPLNPSNP